MNVTPELGLLILTVILSTISVVLAYRARIFQKRASVREAIEQLDSFVETDPDFKIEHSLIEFSYLPPSRSVTLLFRYISLFNSSSTTGGQPRRFHEIMKAGSPFPRPIEIVEDVEGIEGVSNAKFTDRGLEVNIDSLDSIKIVNIIHLIQRNFRHQLRTPDTRK